MLARRLLTVRGVTISAKLIRALHSKPQSLHEVSEVEIPVPWGKVNGEYAVYAFERDLRSRELLKRESFPPGKLWGSRDKQPILAMHGWQDNASSFDVLAPLVVKSTPVLAIDLPGHGLSSWLPPGSMYTELIYLTLIKRIKRYFGWEKVKIMAHSLSAMTTSWYAATFPSDLQYVIALDCVTFPPIDMANYFLMFANAVDAFIKLEESNSDQPSYSESEIVKKWMGAGLLKFDEATCRILMTRGATRKKDGTYVLNRDPKVRVIPIHSIFSREQTEQFAGLITCPYLVLKANGSVYIESKEHFHGILERMRAHNNDVHFKEVPGMHHCHMTHAEPMAAIINPFLEKYDRP